MCLIVELNMNASKAISRLIFITISILGLGIDYAIYRENILSIEGFLFVLIFIALSYLVSYSIKIADQWEKAIVLRLGKFYSLQGPGPFFIIPFIDTVPFWIDTRVITSTFMAERTLTKDTVPVNVDAVLFWKVLEPKNAGLSVADYQGAIGWASKTALRDVIGRTMLSDMLEGREKIGKELQQTLNERSTPWGINIISVEIKDVLIPAALENAMSMQAQAERERQARVILGDSERQVAEKFGEASKTYIDNPTAFHLRAMNMLYEGLKQNSTIVVVPSTAVESMQLGSIAGITALTKELQRERAEREKEIPIIRQQEEAKNENFTWGAK